MNHENRDPSNGLWNNPWGRISSPNITLPAGVGFDHCPSFIHPSSSSVSQKFTFSDSARMRKQKTQVLRPKKTQILSSGKRTWQWKMDNFEDVFPIEHADLPVLCLFAREYSHWMLGKNIMQIIRNRLQDEVKVSNFVKTICEKNIGSHLLLSVEVQRPVTKDHFLSRESESSKICGYHFHSLWLPGTIVFYCNDVCFDSIRNFSWVQDQHTELPRAMMQQQLHQRSIGNSLRRKMMWTNPR